MRVLYWPLYTVPGNVQADSGYICVRNLIRENRDWHWYLLVPDESWDIEWDDELDAMPNVTRVQTPMRPGIRLSEVMSDPDTLVKFSPQEAVRPVEIVVSSSPARMTQIANLYSMRCRPYQRPLTVNWDLLSRDDLQQNFATDEHELMAVYAGVAMADLNVFGSPMMEWMTRRMTRKLLSPSMHARVFSDYETVFAGVPMEKIATVTEGVQKRETFSAFYGGRINTMKRADDLAEVYDTAYRFGRQMDIVMCCGTISGFKEKEFRERFPEIDLKVGTGQNDMWREMASCHVGICYSKHEMIASIVWEQLAAGLPVLVKRHTWNECGEDPLLPPEYPWRFDSKPQAIAMLKLLYDEFQQTGRVDVGPWQQWVHERYDSAHRSVAWKTQVQKRAEARYDDWSTRVDGGFSNRLVDACGEVMRDGMTWHDLMEGLAKRPQGMGSMFAGKTLSQGRSAPSLDVYRMTRYLGWKDDVNESVPRFTKEG